MQPCKFCNTTGSNMKRCKKCGNVWCMNCATRGKGDYPKQKFANVCPYCGGYNCTETPK